MLKTPLSLATKFWIAIVVGILVFVGLVVLATFSPHRTPETAQHTASKQDNSGQPNDITPRVIGPAIIITENQTAAANNEHHYNGENSPQVEGFWSAKITDLALVFFTYCLVVVGWVTVQSNVQTLRELERAYVSLLLENSSLEQMVTVGRASPNAYRTGGASPSVGWKFFNSGRSVADVEVIRAACEFTSAFERAPPYLDLSAIQFLDQTIAVNDKSTDEYSASLERRLTLAEINEIADGNSFFFFFGIIVYRDIFDTRRETAFCLRSERDGTLHYWGGKKYNYRK